MRNLTMTGIQASPDEHAELRALVHEARSTPVILLGGADMSHLAWDRVSKRCHELALAHGLPEITGYYGITSSGEFAETTHA